jgi:hypothetical protein
MHDTACSLSTRLALGVMLAVLIGLFSAGFAQARPIVAASPLPMAEGVTSAPTDLWKSDDSCGCPCSHCLGQCASGACTSSACSGPAFVAELSVLPTLVLGAQVADRDNDKLSGRVIEPNLPPPRI